MQIKYLLLAISVLLTGCATTLEITPLQKQMTSNLNATEADASIKRLFTKTDKHSGLIGTSQTGPAYASDPRLEKVDNGFIHYSDYDWKVTNVQTNTVIYSNNANVNTGVSIGRSSSRKAYKLDLRDVGKIRLVELPPSISSPDKQIISLHEWFTVLTIEVSKEEINEVIALLKFYNPDAKIIKGVGF